MRSGLLGIDRWMAGLVRTAAPERLLRRRRWHRWTIDAVAVGGRISAAVVPGPQLMVRSLLTARRFAAHAARANRLAAHCSPAT
jgi:hypothetical protein